MFEKWRKKHKEIDFMSTLKRKARNKRYYEKHKEELKQKRKEYYSIHLK